MHDPSEKALRRLAAIECAAKCGVSLAVELFRVSRATIYRWMKRFNPHDLRSLEERSRRPHRTRWQQWSAADEEAVLTTRLAHPRWGKAKLRILLQWQAVDLSESTIGRILKSLKRRNLLIEPRWMPVRHRKTIRPYATRVPADKRQPTEPGALIQLDTVHLRPLPGMERRQFTAVDVVSRQAVFGVRSRATAGTATAFLDELVQRFPFPVQAIQVDGGSEFMAGFEERCEERGIALHVLPPRSPKLNGRVERLNGTSRREFWECYDGDLDLPSLQTALLAWEHHDNTERPHQALGYQPPAAFLASLAVSYVSN